MCGFINQPKTSEEAADFALSWATEVKKDREARYPEEPFGPNDIRETANNLIDNYVADSLVDGAKGVLAALPDDRLTTETQWSKVWDW